MRTSIVLDNKLLEHAQKLTGIKTKREVVQVALQTLISLYEQDDGHNLRGRLKREGSLHELCVPRTGK